MIPSSRFIGGVNTPRFGIGIALVDKIYRHEIAHIPDFFGFQISFEIWHGRTCNPVHDLVVEDPAGNFPAFENGEIQRRRIDVGLCRTHPVTDGTVTSQAKILVNLAVPGQAPHPMWDKDWEWSRQPSGT